MEKQKLILIMLIFFQKFMLSSRDRDANHNVMISPYLQHNHQIIDENQIEMIEVKKQLHKNLIMEVKNQLYKNLSPLNDTNNDALPSSHLIANKARNIIDHQINNEQEKKIEIIEVKKKIQEIERPDCLFCASGYEQDKPYSIEVKGTIAEKHAHKPHEDFWHYGCILQYVEYGQKKCPYCTYELCLTNLRFAINPLWPTVRTFPEMNNYRQQPVVRTFRESNVGFGNEINLFNSMPPQNRRSRFLEIFNQCLAKTCYSIFQCCYSMTDCFVLMLHKLFKLLTILFYIILFIPYIIISLFYWVAEGNLMDREECLKCMCSLFTLFLFIVLLHRAYFS